MVDHQVQVRLDIVSWPGIVVEGPAAAEVRRMELWVRMAKVGQSTQLDCGLHCGTCWEVTFRKCGLSTEITPTGILRLVRCDMRRGLLIGSCAICSLHCSLALLQYDVALRCV